MTDTYVIKLRGKTIKATPDNNEFKRTIDQFHNVADISVAVERR